MSLRSKCSKCSEEFKLADYIMIGSPPMFKLVCRKCSSELDVGFFLYLVSLIISLFVAIFSFNLIDMFLNQMFTKGVLLTFFYLSAFVVDLFFLFFIFVMLINLFVAQDHTD
jgi:hypothetical protein